MSKQAYTVTFTTIITTDESNEVLEAKVRAYALIIANVLGVMLPTVEVQEGVH